jgi:hypothetical protein
MKGKWRDAVSVLVIICVLMLAVVRPAFTVPALLLSMVGIYNLIRRRSRS